MCSPRKKRDIWYISLMVNNKRISKINSDFYHVLLVQSPIAVGLENLKLAQLINK